MANTYTQIHIHAIFGVQNRISLIENSWKEELYKYITGIVQNRGHKMLIINGMPDHVHMLFGMRPVESLSDLMKVVKWQTSTWVDDERLVRGKFYWQEGFGAFSYSKSQLPDVINYIENQEKHHKIKTFKEEYEEFLKKFEVDYNDRYLFHDVKL
ncbi:MAG TPA: IS200/IS605 family transposase [Bacteroidales bacterium]|nr:IS200/IS605 family transposase [Bacteroidales bacterium]